MDDDNCCYRKNGYFYKIYWMLNALLISISGWSLALSPSRQVTQITECSQFLLLLLQSTLHLSIRSKDMFYLTAKSLSKPLSNDAGHELQF